MTGFELFGMSWLGDASYAFISVVVVSIWQNLGFYMIIYIAGFMAIPESILEAASIDGANRKTQFLKVKLPLLMPSITICTFYSLTFGLKLFDIILVLTKGGPGNSTKTVAYDIFTDAFMSNKYGIATAKSLIFFVVVLIVTIIQLRYFKNREVEY
jgi:raffinose/stachyose/melibiose transport system permease protein